MHIPRESDTRTQRVNRSYPILPRPFWRCCFLYFIALPTLLPFTLHGLAWSLFHFPGSSHTLPNTRFAWVYVHTSTSHLGCLHWPRGSLASTAGRARLMRCTTTLAFTKNMQGSGVYCSCSDPLISCPLVLDQSSPMLGAKKVPFDDARAFGRDVKANSQPPTANRSRTDLHVRPRLAVSSIASSLSKRCLINLNRL